jgi:flagellar protein FliO/FliZ
MITSFPFSRTAVRAVTLVLGALALSPGWVLALIPAWALVLAPAGAQAFTPEPAGHKPSTESTPLNLTPSKVGATSTSSGPSLVRTIVGLLIVIAVIWGLSWILRQVKSGRENRSAGEGLRSIATLPLGSNRSLHLVRAGADYLLVGSAEHGVAPIHRYTEQQAREAGLIGENEPLQGESPAGSSGRRTTLGAGGERRGGRTAQGARDERRGGPIQMPGQGSGLLERLREWTVRR